MSTDIRGFGELVHSGYTAVCFVDSTAHFALPHADNKSITSGVARL